MWVHTNVIEAIFLLLWPAVRGRPYVLVGHVVPLRVWLAEFVPLSQKLWPLSSDPWRLDEGRKQLTNVWQYIRTCLHY